MVSSDMASNVGKQGLSVQITLGTKQVRKLSSTIFANTKEKNKYIFLSLCTTKQAYGSIYRTLLQTLKLE